MSFTIVDRFVNWMDVQPTIALLMAIAALALFGSALKLDQASPSLWEWIQQIIKASVGAVLFLGLLWAFRSILNSNNTTFNSTHGSLSQTTLESAQSIWGRPHIQRGLAVEHYIEVVEQEEIPRSDPTQPPVYRNKKVRQQVLQNSVVGLKGQVDLTLSEREKGYALYNGFIANARFEYDVVNNSDTQTDAIYTFPLSPQQTMYENFKVMVDDADCSPLLNFQDDQVQWKQTMTPHQRSKAIITYTARGMDYFYYQIPVQRESRNFSLALTVDRLPVSLLNYPEGCLTPTEVKPTADQKGSILVWNLDRAITTAGMGVALPQPEQPGAQVVRVLANSPYALTMLIAMLALTLLIRGQAVRFLELALLAAAYCVQFLVMAAVSDWFLGFWGSLVLGAALTGLLTWLLFRDQPSRLLRVLVYALVAFFTVVYPLSGLVTDVTQRNTFDGLVQVGLIVYLFGLSLYTRLEANRAATAGQ